MNMKNWTKGGLAGAMLLAVAGWWWWQGGSPPPALPPPLRPVPADPAPPLVQDSPAPPMDSSVAAPMPPTPVVTIASLDTAARLLEKLGRTPAGFDRLANYAEEAFYHRFEPFYQANQVSLDDQATFESLLFEREVAVRQAMAQSKPGLDGMTGPTSAMSAMMKFRIQVKEKLGETFLSNYDQYIKENPVQSPSPGT